MPAYSLKSNSSACSRRCRLFPCRAKAFKRTLIQYRSSTNRRFCRFVVSGLPQTAKQDAHLLCASGTLPLRCSIVLLLVGPHTTCAWPSHAHACLTQINSAVLLPAAGAQQSINRPLPSAMTNFNEKTCAHTRSCQLHNSAATHASKTLHDTFFFLSPMCGPFRTASDIAPQGIYFFPPPRLACSDSTLATVPTYKFLCLQARPLVSFHMRP